MIFARSQASGAPGSLPGAAPACDGETLHSRGWPALQSPAPCAGSRSAARAHLFAEMPREQRTNVQREIARDALHAAFAPWCQRELSGDAAVSE
eukprot:2565431-Pleurochrysis_carterae.AAC.1